MVWALSASGQLIGGEKSVGPKIGYISHNQSCVAGLAFQCSVAPHVRIAPEIGCAFRNKSEDAFLIDLNVHMPFAFADVSKASLYPLAGLTFNSWNYHGVSVQDEVDVTTHENRLGLNLGAGFDMRCSETLKLNIEAKYSLVKSYSSAIITAGISYVF